MPTDLSETLDKKGGIAARLKAAAASRPDLPALIGNRRCRHERLTYRETFDLVDRFAAGLLERGVAHADRIGLVSESFDLWIVSDLALISLGAVDVPRGGDASADEIQFCLSHAGSRAAIVEGKEQLEKLGDLAQSLDFVIVLRSEDVALDERIISFDQVLEAGDARLATDPGCIDAARDGVSSGDVATVIYTSGTTGNPKGVVLTHGNILHNLHCVPDVLDLQEGQRYLSFLPTWHIFERTLEYVVLDRGLELHYSSKWSLKQDFPKVRPTLVAAVPRVWEGFFSAIETGLAKKKPFVQKIVRGALEGSRVRTDTMRRLRGEALGKKLEQFRPSLGDRLSGLVLGVLLWLPHKIADALVYSKVRTATGGAITAGISGGGPLPDYVDEFINRAGVPLFNGYGLTETSPVLSVRMPSRNILGTIGQALPFTEFRIVDEQGQSMPVGERGVIQARGPQIMQGYHANESATSAALPGDGWFDTGDLGMLGPDGDLLIRGRAKDTIVLRGGENVEPEPIEAAINRSALIADCLLVGHGEKVLAALVVPAPDAVRSELGIVEADDAALARRDDVFARLKDEVTSAVSRANGYRNFEMIGHVAMLETPFNAEDGTATATLKKRRRVIEERYADLIASLYA